MNFVGYVRDLVFLWGTVIAVVTGSIFYYNEFEPILNTHRVEIFLGVLTIVSSLAVWFTLSHKVAKVNRGLDSIHIALLKSDVDRFYSQHKDCQSLSDDDLKYLLMLQDKLSYYKINSFTQRKVDKLLSKE